MHAILKRPARRPPVDGTGVSSVRPYEPVRGGLLSHPLLPRIDVSKKIFFNHVHKCAGTAFTAFLQQQIGTSWCASLVAADNVRPSSERALVDWWFDGLPNCTLLALESPSLGELVVTMGAEREARATAVASWLPVVDYYEPQTLSFYRDPYERCQSEWRYEQVCRAVARTLE